MSLRAQHLTSKRKKRKNTTTGVETGLRIFEWTMKHLDAFDALKEALSTAPNTGLS